MAYYPFHGHMGPSFAHPAAQAFPTYPHPYGVPPYGEQIRPIFDPVTVRSAHHAPPNAFAPQAVMADTVSGPWQSGPSMSAQQPPVLQPLRSTYQEGTRPPESADQAPPYSLEQRLPCSPPVARTSASPPHSPPCPTVSPSYKFQQVAHEMVFGTSPPKQQEPWTQRSEHGVAGSPSLLQRLHMHRANVPTEQVALQAEIKMIEEQLLEEQGRLAASQAYEGAVTGQVTENPTSERMQSLEAKLREGGPAIQAVDAAPPSSKTSLLEWGERLKQEREARERERG